MDTEPTTQETTDESPAENLPATHPSAEYSEGPTRAGPPTVERRYAALELEEDALVIYDRENTDAWLQTDRPADLVEGGHLDG